MRAVIIGGTGHVGIFLVPRLINAGYEVIVVSRQDRQAYQSHAAWQSVRQIQIDRVKAEVDGTFREQIREMAPDVVIDMICFTQQSAMQLVEAVRGHIQHFLHCGTI